MKKRDKDQRRKRKKMRRLQRPDKCRARAARREERRAKLVMNAIAGKQSLSWIDSTPGEEFR